MELFVCLFVFSLSDLMKCFHDPRGFQGLVREALGLLEVPLGLLREHSRLGLWVLPSGST